MKKNLLGTGIFLIVWPCGGLDFLQFFVKYPRPGLFATAMLPHMWIPKIQSSGMPVHRNFFFLTRVSMIMMHPLRRFVLGL